ncbi:NIPSNAP family protein [Marinilongibacter aquaticus]|uniref:NIPSNAP family protein n=1 Tax=Marinilongibacter aquaticus TaxID=2975157 RepID=UPI0021BDEF38|nr:NIPSNAP family protein [Marinilongibacter aquaticus]UBM57869.1 NIPSNAP family protein [Marinilongibacter aquaticus]
MKKILTLSLLLFALSFSTWAKADTKVYELRIYHCFDGRRPALIKRFKDHTRRIFEKHGMENIGYWLPTSDDMKNDLIYMLAYPSMEAREAAWKAFGADPEWQKVAADSQIDGKIVRAVDNTFLKLEPSLVKKLKLKAENPSRIFELRSYFCYPGKFPNIVKRFDDGTVSIFKRVGFENIAYWSSIEKEGKQPHLVYIIAHESEAAAKENWKKFGADPEWKTLKANSELGGKIVEHVESIYMEPLPFSKIR